MGYSLKTTNGYDLFEMSSMLQKAIRRCDIPHAAYAVNELSIKYRNYMWKRLLTVSAEDCYGIMTKEIIALKEADEIVNKGNKQGDTNDLFIAKAVVLLCMARKNRDADYVACNFMWGDKCLTDEEFNEFVDYKQVEELRIKDASQIPGYVYDVHTKKGKSQGKTKLDMFIGENEALKPRQISLFDYGSFGEFFDRNPVRYSEKEKLKEFQKDKVTDPTENGKNWNIKPFASCNMR